MDKQHINGSAETLVTFRVPAEVRARTVSVVGEFNDWSEDAHPCGETTTPSAPSSR